MFGQIPMKVLELNVISAHDLPPVSKMLRTYAVAWVHPDQKMTTRVDHKGHINPTWNYKFSFRVDDRFLKSDSSAITIEIYNVSWLRDLPIGTSRVLITTLFPPSVARRSQNTSLRSVALQISRPSGHLQGTLNMGVNLYDNSIPSVQLSGELSASGEETNEQIQEERSEEITQLETIKAEPVNEDKSSVSKGSTLKRGSDPSGIQSLGNNSVIQRLPSEVAEDMKRGLYWTAGDEIGSTLFENWTVVGDKDDWMESKVVTTKPEEEIPLVKGPRIRSGKKRRSNGGGLLSCFGNAYGFEFTMVCCGNAMKKKMKNRKSRRLSLRNSQYLNHPLEDLRGLYV